MRKLVFALPIIVLMGCNDKDDDTGSDTAANTAESTELESE